MTGPPCDATPAPWAGSVAAEGREGGALSPFGWRSGGIATLTYNSAGASGNIKEQPARQAGKNCLRIDFMPGSSKVILPSPPDAR